GVEEAERQAEHIVSQAQQKAATIVREAEERKKSILEQAKRDAEIYTQRSQTTLEQAARDLLLTVANGIENILSDLVAEAVEESLDGDTLKALLTKVVDQCLHDQEVSKWEIRLNPEDRKQLVHFFAQRYKERMHQGIELKDDQEILKGFQISFYDSHISLDFTADAVSEALSSLLQPHLAEIVTRVAGEQHINERIQACLERSENGSPTREPA
ncbi:MAG: V-type ATP synthase subunit E family protein, partial [Thermodesulfobacteriota bacterium]